MAIVKDAMFEKEYNCLTSDLVDNFPPTTDYELGAQLCTLGNQARKH